MAPAFSAFETRDIFFTSGSAEALRCDRFESAPPADNLGARTRLPATTGPLLAATLFVPHEIPPARLPALIVAHGAGSRRTRHQVFCAEACRAGFAVLALDFRGHGDSEGLADGPMEQDVLAAVRILRQLPEVDPEAICYRGSSMGGFYGLMAAPDAGFAAMALVCPASEKEFLEALDKRDNEAEDYGPDLQEDGGPRFPTSAPGEPPRWDTQALRRYFQAQDSMATASRVDCPVIIVHSRADAVVPLGHSLALIQHLAGEATLLALPWGSHSTAQHDPTIHRRTLLWLKQSLESPCP